jgi:4'-phosphopantetheinyl transferase
LPPSERARATHYARPEDRAAFVVGRQMLRSVLASCGQGLLAGADLVYGPHGKPGLPPSLGFQPVSFNLSHSGGIVLLAVANGSEVGVDIERTRPVTSMASMAQRALMPAECEALFAQPADEQQGLFFRYWARKEALLKAHGAALASALGWEPVPAWPSVKAWKSPPPAPEGWQRVRCVLEGRGTGEWCLFDLEPGPGYAGAVAVAAASTTWRLQRRTWPGEQGGWPAGT